LPGQFQPDFTALDSFWNLGLKPGGIIVIAARPGMGKTSFLLLVGKCISQHFKTQIISFLEYS
jgi:replicative DNA helicase